MADIWMRESACINTHTSITHMSASYHTYCVRIHISHIWMRHGLCPITFTQLNAKYHMYEHAHKYYTYECVISHILCAPPYFTRMDEARTQLNARDHMYEYTHECHTYDASYHTYCLRIHTSHVWIRHGRHMNARFHMYEYAHEYHSYDCVISQISCAHS